jgi:hypothetical protein
MAAVGYEPMAAQKELQKRIHADKKLYEAVTEPLLQAGILRAVHTALTARFPRKDEPEPKRGLPTPKLPKSAAAAGMGRLEIVATATKEALLGLELAAGRPLADATKEEIEMAASGEAQAADRSQRRARWLKLVASRLNEKQTPRQAGLSDKELQALAERVGGLD